MLFCYCTALRDVTFPTGAADIAAYAFSGCTALESLIIPDNITSIGEHAFYNCTALTDAVIGNGVSDIGEHAFSGCTALSGVTLGNSVVNIGNYAFFGCKELAGVNIPNSVKLIGSAAFSDCTSIKSITIPDTGIEIGWYAFENCTALKDISIGSGVTYIGYRAFNATAYYNDGSNWDGDTLYIDGCLIKVRENMSGSYSIKDGTRLVADCAFRDCAALESVSLPDSLTKTGRYTFRDCTSLTNVSIPDSVTELGDSVFRGCTALARITIPDSITSIGHYAFYGCTALKNITIPNGVKSIGESAFYNCTALKNIAIPDSVTSIGESAFYNCTALKGITIPNGVTSIGYKSFYSCKALTLIVLPDSVASIGESAFYNCSALKDIYYSGTEAQWKAILVESGNDSLKNAIMHYGSVQHPHAYTDEVTAPTCTERGFTTHICDCGSSYVDSSVRALGHDYKDGACTRCGVKDPDYQPPHTHSYTDKVTAPTCTERGYTTHTCACGDSKVDTYVDALGHAYKDGVCIRCGADDPDYQPPHTHSYTDKVTAPTCTEKGYTTYTCSCGDSYKDDYTAALGHNYKGGVCTRCGADDPGYQPPHSHSYTDKVTAPTCTEKGYTTHTCSCGDSYVDSYVNALGHDYKDGVCTRCSAKDPDYKEPTPAVSFTDVADKAYYAAPVAWAVEKGITGGYPDNTFKPMNTCTRAQIVTFIWRAMGSPEPAGTAKGFNDVFEGTYYYKAVLWAAEQNITGGFNDGGFHPDELVTRAQAMTFLWRAEGKPAVPAGTTNTFVDVPEGAYYHDAVLWAVASGVTGGYDSQHFGSMDGCTRAQIVTFLYRDMA